MGVPCDFSGWATKNDLKCSDGRTIRRDAFKDNDGQTVPLVWQHQHNDPSNVLGHALLENRPEGVFAYGFFNETAEGQRAKALVEHGDITSLSIYANKLKQTPAKDVLHGVIREVSLVLSPANPGASIIFPTMAHGDEFVEVDDEATIFTGEPLYLSHADDEEPDEEEAKEPSEEKPKKEKTIKDVFDELTEEQKNVVYYMIGQAIEQKDAKAEKEPSEKSEEKEEEAVKHADNSEQEPAKKDEGGTTVADNKEKTVKDVFDELTEEQKNVVYFMIGQALEDAKKGNKSAAKADAGEGEEAQHSYYGGNEMKYNVFDTDMAAPQESLSHADIQTIFKDAKRCGSLRDAILQHMESGVLSHTVTNEDGTTQTYGIANVDYLFPDAQTLAATPYAINQRTEWVKKVLDGTHHTPFSRVKSIVANLTVEEARAKGYIKGGEKTDEVFGLLKRVTEPQTVYKKQRMDKDDISDITSFDVIAYLKQEMRGKLDEELARAFLIGDGRGSTSDDKIDETRIRPIASDADLYTIKANVTEGDTDEDTAKNIRRAILEAMKTYDGSGTPTFFVSSTWLNELMLMEDGIGHPLYETEAKLASALRVKEIVAVPVMDGKQVGGKDLIGVIVNLQDYNVGADKGGQVSMFDDFDLDYNQQKYLIETRCSGALIRPYSAITLVVNPQ